MKKNLKALLKESNGRINVYKKAILEAEKSFRELNSDNMQGTLIQIEDYLDSNQIYAFENWFDGVVWDGPNIKRYWVTVTLKYPYNKMPNPQAALRLVNTGAKVTFKESDDYVAVKVEKPDDLDPTTRKPKEKKERIWLVTLQIPRRFIEGAVDDDVEVPTEQPNALEPNKEEPKEEEAPAEAPEKPAGEAEEVEL